MLGPGFTADAISALIEQELHLHVAFPCFPLEASVGHTACSVVRNSWLGKLRNPTGNGSKVIHLSHSSGNTGEKSIDINTEEDMIEVNVFITVIAKHQSQRDGWTRPQVFERKARQKPSVPSATTQGLLTAKYLAGSIISTSTSIPNNSEWNLTAEAYVRELLSTTDGTVARSNGLQSQTGDGLSYEFRPIFKDVDSDSSTNNNEDPHHEKLIEQVLAKLYPTTLRYRIVNPMSTQVDEEIKEEKEEKMDEEKKKLQQKLGSTSSNTLLGNDLYLLSVLPPKSFSATASSNGEEDQGPTNIAAATAIIESDTSYYCISPHRAGGAHGMTTLQDLLRFNPGVLGTPLKKGFLVYQLLKATQGLHERGIAHGSLASSTVLIDESLWATLSNIQCAVPLEILPAGHDALSKIPANVTDESVVMKWVRGEISNFTYLMLLNHAAGRRQGDPNVHPIFPWVTDFSGPNVSKNWRDFTRTKFRLNKGDEQLDVTYDGPFPHHITDILSDITYYVYMARQIPIPVLCQFVRSKYEANEYPPSMARLYEWTPDECIPEFYTDASIFKSIHADMPDLLLPLWAKTPEEFIEKHMAALESDHVSSQLHHWINLTFGSNLSGSGAIEAKNVALSLFPGGQGDALMRHGIIQLFKDPHPQKVMNWTKSKTDFMTLQEMKPLTLLERASAINKRRSTLKPQQVDKPQFVGKVSEMLFRPNAPSRSKSLRIPTARSRPSSTTLVFDREPNGSVSGASKGGGGGSGVESNIGNNYGPGGPAISTANGSTSNPAVAPSLPGASGGSTSTTSVTSPSTALASGGLGSSLAVSGVLLEQPELLQSGSNGASNTSSIKPETLIQLIQAEPIDLPEEIGTMLFTDELEHFEKTLEFGTKYHFMSSRELTSKFGLDKVTAPERNGGCRVEETFEYMRKWDTFCLGQIVQQIYLAEGIPNNSIAMTMRDNDHLADRGDVDADVWKNVLPSVVKTIQAMIQPDWKLRPNITDILQQTIPVLAPQFPTISMFVPSSVAEIYDFLATYYVGSSAKQLELAQRWIDRICLLEDETFEIVLPIYVHLFTNHATRIAALTLFPKLGQRVGIDRAKTAFLKPIIALFESSGSPTRPILAVELFDLGAVTEFIRRFGSSTFLQQIFPYYLEALAVDYQALENQALAAAVAAAGTEPDASTPSGAPTAIDVNSPVLSTVSTKGEEVISSSSSSSTTAAATAVAAASAVAAVSKPVAAPPLPKMALLASEAFVGVCRSLGSILTSKHVMKPLCRLAYKEPASLAILKMTMSHIAAEFGSIFALVQYNQLIHMVESTASTTAAFTTRNSHTLTNLLGMLTALVPQMYDHQLINELKNGGSELLYRLIEPGPLSVIVKPKTGKAVVAVAGSTTSVGSGAGNAGSTSSTMYNSGTTLSQLEPLGHPRLLVSKRALDFILEISYSLARGDWERYVAPILQKYFSGFGPDLEEFSSTSNGHGMIGVEHSGNHSSSTSAFSRKEKSSLSTLSVTAPTVSVSTSFTPAAPGVGTIDYLRNEQMMYAYGQFCSCVGQDAMQSMIPSSDAIERLIADRLDSIEFGNSPLRSLGSVTAQGKFVLSSTNSFWQAQKDQQQQHSSGLGSTKDGAGAGGNANQKKSFSTKDLWFATSASMSKALSLFDNSKAKANAANNNESSHGLGLIMSNNSGNGPGSGGSSMYGVSMGGGSSSLAGGMGPTMSTPAIASLAMASSNNSLALHHSNDNIAKASEFSSGGNTNSGGYAESGKRHTIAGPIVTLGSDKLAENSGNHHHSSLETPTTANSTRSRGDTPTTNGSLSPTIGYNTNSSGAGSHSIVYFPQTPTQRKTKQSFGAIGKAKIAARMEQLSNWNRFLSTNQEEMAQTMQFPFNDWKLQGLEGHTGGIKVVGANEYQRVFATGSKDKTVKLWSLDIHHAIEATSDSASGTGSTATTGGSYLGSQGNSSNKYVPNGCLMTYTGHRRGPVYDLHFTSGGGSFGTGDNIASCDGQIHLWEPETGRSIHQFGIGRSPVVTMAPIHRSRYIVAGLMDSSLNFLDSHQQTTLHHWRTTNLMGLTIKVLATSPNENLMAVGLSNGTISLLDSRTGTLVANWRASDNEIGHLKFYTNSLLLSSAAADHMICIWNVSTLSLVKTIRSNSEIISLEIFKDEIMTMHHSNAIAFTPMNDDALAYTSKFKSSAIRSSISCLSILPMNQLLVLGCSEGEVYLYS